MVVVVVVGGTVVVVVVGGGVVVVVVVVVGGTIVAVVTGVATVSGDGIVVDVVAEGAMGTTLKAMVNGVGPVVVVLDGPEIVLSRAKSGDDNVVLRCGVVVAVCDAGWTGARPGVVITVLLVSGGTSFEDTLSGANFGGVVWWGEKATNTSEASSVTAQPSAIFRALEIFPALEDEGGRAARYSITMPLAITANGTRTKQTAPPTRSGFNLPPMDGRSERARTACCSSWRFCRP